MEEKDTVTEFINYIDFIIDYVFIIINNNKWDLGFMYIVIFVMKKKSVPMKWNS